MQIQQAPGSVPMHPRDQTLAQLRRAEQQLAEAQALAHVGSWEWDLVADRLTWSDEHYRIFGLEPQACPVQFPATLQHVHPDDRAKIKRLAERALADHQPYSCEFRIVLPDGAERIGEAHARVELNAAGLPARMHGTVQDVTERRRAEDVRQHLLGRAISAQEEERQRVARELHDETGQALTAILVGLRNVEAAVSGTAARHLVDDLRHLVEATIRDVGRIARGLRPSVLDDLGLIPALERYAADLTASRDLTVHIRGEAGALP